MEQSPSFLNSKRERSDEIEENLEVKKLNERITTLRDDFEYISVENKKLKEMQLALETKNSSLRYVINKLNNEKTTLNDENSALREKLKTSVDDLVEERSDYLFQFFINQERKREQKTIEHEEKLKKLEGYLKELIENKQSENELELLMKSLDD